MINIQVPIDRRNECEWICRVIFKEFLGLELSFSESKNGNFVISYLDRSIEIANILLIDANVNWLKENSLPQMPLREWKVDIQLVKPLIAEQLPILYGSPLLERKENTLFLGFDVIGSLFFMLSRYEEVVKQDRDQFDRFPASASLAFKENFLDRPLADEYVEVMWACIKMVWPSLERKPTKGRSFITCDVDYPFDSSLYSVKEYVRNIAADLLKRKDPIIAIKRTLNLLVGRFNNYKLDPNYIFDRFMFTCEKYGHKAAFYFIADKTAGTIDGFSRITEPRVVNLIKMISERGHEIGQHGSFNTYNNPDQIAKERSILLDLCKSANIPCQIEGNRQHYLRFDSKQTPAHLEEAGFTYDSTGSFADMPGFRYGTTRSFSMWDWKNNKALKLKQMPLALMECSVIAKRYMGLGYSKAALEKMKLIKERSLRFGGDFVLLWHNSHFNNKVDFTFFEAILSDS